MAVAMAALEATVVVLTADGERHIPIDELYRLPGDAPDRDTVLDHGDLITAVELPALPFATRSTYRKVRDRASYAFALVSVAAALDIADGVIRDARLALGGVAHKPWRAKAAEERLRGVRLGGTHPTEEAFREAALAELAAARPLPGNRFKVPMVANTMIAVLRELGGTELGSTTELRSTS
jgi:xanthine dehydrogenase YagS FAD-binding subunit